MTGLVARIDDLGLPAWIALMVVSFVLFWPVGLAVLAYLIWSGRMGCRRFGGEGRGRWEHRMAGMQERMGRWGCGGHGRPRGAVFTASGNRAFDAYREEMLKRLEDEASEFTAFLERLRHAKDKAEFDQFMTERRNRPTPPPAEPHPDNGGSVPNAG
jgi:hypothetical protein